MKQAVRIALADDQALVREGLKAVLRELGIEIALEAGDGQALLGALPAAAVDVVVSDVRMPVLDGIGLVRALRAAGSTLPVILLTTFDESELLLRAVEAGAQGFLLKDASPEDLHEAILGAAEGRGWLQPVSTAPVRERYAFHDQRAPQESFSEREVGILRLLAGGYSNKEIARSLHLAEGTVKNYVSEILAKLDTRDRTRAVLKAITLRVI
jgi:DNA-binding NarL/FixJ family response regulator